MTKTHLFKSLHLKGQLGPPCWSRYVFCTKGGRGGHFPLCISDPPAGQLWPSSLKFLYSQSIKYAMLHPKLPASLPASAEALEATEMLFIWPKSNHCPVLCVVTHSLTKSLTHSLTHSLTPLVGQRFWGGGKLYTYATKKEISNKMFFPDIFGCFPFTYSGLQMSIWSKAEVCVSFEECQYAAETDIGTQQLLPQYHSL